MFIKLNTNTLYVNFIKHKKRIYSYTHYTYRGVSLHFFKKQEGIIYIMEELKQKWDIILETLKDHFDSVKNTEGCRFCRKNKNKLPFPPSTNVVLWQTHFLASLSPS